MSSEVRLFGLTSALKLRTVTPIINLWAVFSTAANACILSYVIGSLATCVAHGYFLFFRRSHVISFTSTHEIGWGGGA